MILTSGLRLEGLGFRLKGQGAFGVVLKGVGFGVNKAPMLLTCRTCRPGNTFRGPEEEMLHSTRKATKNPLLCERERQGNKGHQL